MKQTGQPFYRHLICILSCLAVAALWACCAVPYVSPVRCNLLAVVGLAFPFFLLAVLVMQLLCVLLARRWWWIPFAGLVVASLTIRTYFPLNLPSDPPAGSIKVVTYNTFNYASKSRDADGRLSVVNYLIRQRADIICLQEAAVTPPHLYDTDVRPPLQAAGTAHFDSVNIGNNILALYSRYPIVEKRTLCAHGVNGAALFKLLLAPADTLHVINCHLESMHLGADDRRSYRTMVRAEDNADIEGRSRHLMGKIRSAAVARARQADAVAEYVEAHPGKSFIVCGDFNDSPVSYTRRRIAEGLTDAYRESGNGLGRSFNRDAIVVRIDHLFCSDDWTPYSCTVDRSIQASDHYPVTAYLKRER